MNPKLLLAFAVLAVAASPRAQAQPQVLAAPRIMQMPPNVKGDGLADDTAAIQAALDAAGKLGGEVVLPSGKYLLRGTLSIPTGVVLSGSWQEPHHGAWQSGSTLLVTGGRGDENAAPSITLQQSSALRGFTMLWPEQKWPDIVAYPWAIHGVGMHNTVENVTFCNAYQGIKIGQPSSELHLIRNVFGCVLRRGIFIDSTTDIGRLENVHFNPHYWPRSNHPSSNGAKDMDIAGYMAQNLEAFIFGRSDWQYVTDCFVFAAKVGYHFIETPAGACNAQLLNIGGDYCQTGLLIDKIQPIGIQVTNGAFTSFGGGPNVGIATSPGAVGAAQFVNCNFWATPGGAARLEGALNVAFSDCHFLDVPGFDADHAAINASAGRLNLRGCTFGKAGRAIDLKRGVLAAIVAQNLQPGGLNISNGIGRRAQLALNEEIIGPSGANYRIKMGAGDESWVRGGFYGAEATKEAPAGSPFGGARWSSGAGRIELPVASGQAYTARVFLSLRPRQPAQTISIEGGPAATASKEGAQVLELKIPAALTQGKTSVMLKIGGATWKPSVLMAPDKDARDLGAYLLGVEMTSQPAAPIEDLN